MSKEHGPAPGPRVLSDTPGEMVSVNVLEKYQLGQAQLKSYTMAELNQQTSRVLDEINAAGESALITKHGRLVALVQPLASMKIESMVLSQDTELTRSLLGANDEEAGMMSSEDVALRLGIPVALSDDTGDCR
ncbi:type II toxin-antitoxin system Phd/YefM family antitoxin [Winogradskya humida]|uniref:Antitoxin n=1 Tax=Winogradskya humida TaxID=113566 RepID=A0ABQ3ZF10_9ACTN|nr:hypothetical protein [Actinoplanes humidus]GIE17139.1 hypothetical protein Ahu01nite_002410 [Actinoplanes humidus]